LLIAVLPFAINISRLLGATNLPEKVMNRSMRIVSNAPAWSRYRVATAFNLDQCYIARSMPPRDVEKSCAKRAAVMRPQ
jgi:hypothetical protein